VIRSLLVSMNGVPRGHSFPETGEGSLALDLESAARGQKGASNGR